MTKLEQLIEELCPNGVEYKKLSELLNIQRGVRVVRNQLNDTGEYPVYQNSLTPMGYHTASNFPANTTFIIGAGAAGEIGYSYVDFWAADDCFCIVCPDEYNSRFLFHYLLSQQEFLLSKVRKASIPRLSRTVIESLKMPFPPLPVQNEIVRILDNFTELTAELTAGLTAELTARKKQYEYYRDSLLTFADDVPRVELSTVIKSLNTGLNPRQFFKLNTDDATNWYVTIREIQNNTVVFSEKTDRINNEALRLCNNRSNLEVGDVLFSGTGTIGETAIIDEPPLNWNIKEGVYTIKPIQEKLNSRFLMYLLHTTPIRTAIMKKVAGGTVKSIPMGEMKKLTIPLPTIEEQKTIVALLDRFDTLCNDISTGLPEEIEGRRKQYEYYRDKLLTFKELGV